MSKVKKVGLRRSAFLVAALALVFVCLPTAFASAKAKQCPPRNKGADTVLINGKILTVDRHDSVAQAVAIRDGKIIAVGSNWTMAKFMQHDTKVINLHGRTATPGMIDSHIHFAGTTALYVLDLSALAVNNIADVQAKVAAQCQLLGPGDDKWVQGSGWSVDHLAEHRLLSAADLDPYSPNNPVVLTETSGHMCVANSLALSLAGITASTPDPPAGVIDRYPDGTPTGILRESAASLVKNLIPPFTLDQVETGTRYIVKEANSKGLTSILYPGINDTTWQAFNDVYNSGDLTVRCAMLWRQANTATLADGQALVDKIKSFTHPYNKDNDMLWSQGVKMFMDGAQDSDSHWSWQQHWVDFTHPNPVPDFGYPVADPATYRALVKLYNDNGLQVQTHAIGDRAIDWVVGSYKAALEADHRHGLRDGVIHCDIPTDWALKTIRELQRKYDSAIVYTNPDFMWWTEKICATMGPALSLREMPYKTYEQMGINYSFGTDWSVDPMDPKYSIWDAITRDTLVGLYGPHPFGLAQCINVHQALRAQTSSSAYGLFMENKLGSIEPGKYADIAIWDKDWYTVPTSELPNENCEMTLLGGKIVYQAANTPITVSN